MQKNRLTLIFNSIPNLNNLQGWDEASLQYFLIAKKLNKGKRYLPLILKKFEECGWSVIADINIPKNTFICEYSGNVKYYFLLTY